MINDPTIKPIRWWLILFDPQPGYHHATINQLDNDLLSYEATSQLSTYGFLAAFWAMRRVSHQIIHRFHWGEWRNMSLNNSGNM